MAAATTPLIRAFECSIPSASTAVKASSSYPFVLFRSAPVNVTHIFRLSPPSSSSIPSWVSPKPRISPSTVVPLVAQTADWAQQEQEDEDSVNELDWGEKAVNGMEAGAGLSWEEDKGGEDAGEGSLFHGVLDVGSKGPPNSTPPKAARLFVRNLTPDIDGENLAQLFDQAGVVETAEVIYSRETDQSRGFGFVTMSTVEEAEKAMEMFHRYDLKGQLLLVNIAAPRGSRPRPPGSIYVVNLSWQVDSDRLRQVFSQHGKVINARVISDRETGRSRGYGFVTMSTQTEMNEAIAALNGQSLDGREMKMKVTEKRPRRTSL